jgi:hypothetical protein
VLQAKGPKGQRVTVDYSSSFRTAQRQQIRIKKKQKNNKQKKQNNKQTTKQTKTKKCKTQNKKNARGEVLY